MLKVVNEVKIYEVFDSEGNKVETDSRTLIVKNDWVWNNMVVLELDGRQIQVSAKDLKTAIENATNTNPF